MRKFVPAIFFLLAVSFIFCHPLYPASSKQKDSNIQAMAIDIDHDGEADVVYYYDQENITMAEADTNKDGKPDVRVYAEKGKFKSAEADTDYDGEADRQFDDSAAFSAWLNQSNPEYEDYLNRPNWKKTMFAF